MRAKDFYIVPIALLITLFGSMSLFEKAAAQTADNVKRPSAKQKDNSGRKLALVSGISKDETVDVNKDAGDGVAKLLIEARKKLSDELEARNIPVQVPQVAIPTDLEGKADDAYKACKSALTFLREHAEFTTWFGRYFKQLLNPPKMTPCASPYLIEDRVIPPGVGMLDAKLYLTHDQHTKTLVNH